MFDQGIIYDISFSKYYISHSKLGLIYKQSLTTLFQKFEAEVHRTVSLCMPRANERASYKQQYSLDSNDGHNIKYTSQPYLNESVSDYLGQCPPCSVVLNILTLFVNKDLNYLPKAKTP